jgi:hypothetical protein
MSTWREPRRDAPRCRRRSARASALRACRHRARRIRRDKFPLAQPRHLPHPRARPHPHASDVHPQLDLDHGHPAQGDDDGGCDHTTDTDALECDARDPPPSSTPTSSTHPTQLVDLPILFTALYLHNQPGKSGSRRPVPLPTETRTTASLPATPVHTAAHSHLASATTAHTHNTSHTSHLPPAPPLLPLQQNPTEPRHAPPMHAHRGPGSATDAPAALLLP